MRSQAMAAVAVVMAVAEVAVVFVGLNPRIAHAGCSRMRPLQPLALDPHAPLHPAHSRVTQAKLHQFQDGAARFEASTRQCCAAAQWAAQRVAASYRAMADFKEQ